ncbi:uncharacterized protein BKA55DRAFT_544783 [Fusarium redolens]|uniref:Hydrophobin n=1 Tax=Fusarium redolens TaxID=48865 RepID=A0A9P9JSG7_FUSRE|nr:uncharacterized protein BKA55DRAFT_544783 [Fusarium redolens]KAH7231641.1 hypothetical protein BKA55DRAFT_544783 [Fusarium redolens]
MRLPISLFLPALWVASYVVGKGPSGLKPLPITCDSCCPPGVSCPANDGCFIQGRANMSAEAGDRCSSTVESVIAAEQTSCAASISSAISSVSSALTQCQAAAASGGQKCGVLGLGQGHYQRFIGVDLRRGVWLTAGACRTAPTWSCSTSAWGLIHTTATCMKRRPRMCRPHYTLLYGPCMTETALEGVNGREVEDVVVIWSQSNYYKPFTALLEINVINVDARLW